MSIFSSIKSIFNTKPTNQTTRPSTPPPLPPPEPEPEIEVPEISVADLQMQSQAAPDPIYVLDVREPYEWRQVRMDGAKSNLELAYISMNSVPDQLAELPTDRQIVVSCAHGQRSYGVAHYLIENGLDAVSLAGGVTSWAQEGGAVEMGEQ